MPVVEVMNTAESTEPELGDTSDELMTDSEVCCEIAAEVEDPVIAAEDCEVLAAEAEVDAATPSL